MSNSVTIIDSASDILAGILTGDPTARPNVMYVEFQAHSTAKVTDLPVVDPAETDYYLKLRDNTGSSRDFLRIPVASVTTRREDPNNPNNVTVYFNGICVGDTGVGGKDIFGGLIYGIALVNSPTYGLGIDDLTRDRVWARGYFSEVNQMPTSTVTQTSITFKLKLST